MYRKTCAEGSAGSRRRSWKESEGKHVVEKLVKKAQRGDKNAFVELIERCKLSMSRTAMAILHDEDDSADAISETVLTAFSKLCDLREPKYFKTWLTRILLSNCYAISRQRQRSLSLDSLEEQGWNGVPSGERVEDRDNVIDIQRSFSQLAENDRLVLGLFYLDDLPIRDIASLLNVKESTVKTRLMRGRDRFRKTYLEKEEKYCEASGK